MKAIVTKSEKHDDILMLSKSNPNQASIMLVSETFTQNDQGFLQKSKRVGLVKGETSLLKDLIKSNGIKEGDDWSKKVQPVKLVVQESIVPFYDTQDPKIYPVGSDNEGEIITHKGNPVYRQTLVVTEGSDIQDTLLSTDNILEENVKSDKEIMMEEGTKFAKP